jgi:Pilus assembly protein, PilO
MTRSQERLLGVAALALLLVRPQRDAAAQANADERVAEAESQTLRDEIKALEALQANAPALREEARKAAAEFPPTPALSSLVSALQDAADQAGVELESVAPSPPQASKLQPGLAEITTQLKVNGGYFEIEDFLTRLEALVMGTKPNGRVGPRSLLVHSVALSAGAGTDSDAAAPPAATGTASAPPDELSAAISLSAFQLAGSANATAPTAGATATTGTQGG